MHSTERDLLVGPLFTLPTPFKDSGEIDFGALRALLQFLRTMGVSSVVTNGTTSEFSALSMKERQSIVETVREEFPGRIIDHIGSCCAGECVHLLEHSRAFADGLLVLPPFFQSGVSEEGVCRFWSRFFGLSSVPIYLYHFPQHTQVMFSAQLVKRMADEFEMVRGVKDSGRELEVSVAFKIRDDFEVFVGSEGSTLEALKRGLRGAVCGLGNALPEFQMAIHEWWRAGKLEQALRIQETYSRWLDFRRRFGLEPAALVKAGIAARLPGFPVSVRPPLLPLDEARRKAACGVIDDLLRDYEGMAHAV